jgi:hypothetical protein
LPRLSPQPVVNALRFPYSRPSAASSLDVRSGFGFVEIRASWL